MLDRLQPDRLHHARSLQHVEDRPLGNRARGAATSTGSCSTAIGKPSSAASPSRIRSVRAYVKNHNLGLEVPYRYGSEMRKYLPDFIVLVDDGHGDDDLLHLIVEIKGYRREDAKEKKSTMDTYWVPGVNNLGTYGRWAFAEFTEVYQIEADFKAKVESEFNKMIASVARSGRRNWHGKEHGQTKISAEEDRTLTHDEAKRKNIPTAEYQSVIQKEEESPRRSTITRNTDLDPQLVWRGKDEQDWSDLVVHAPPLYIQEKVHPKVLIDDLLRQTREQRDKRLARRRICSPTSTASPRCGQDRVLPARPELVEPHDPRRLACR